MKRNLGKPLRIVAIALLLVTCLLCVTQTPQIADGISKEPNWSTSVPVHLNSDVSLEKIECTKEIRNISGVLPRQYTNNLDHTTQELCVYHAAGYDYARYARDYYMYPWWHDFGAFTESGLAISFNGGDMKPSFTIGNRDSVAQHFLGETTGFLQQTSLRASISYYKDISKHVVDNEDGTVSLDNQPDYEFRESSSGRPLNSEGVGVSRNKRFVSFVSPNIGLMTLDLNSLSVRRISDRYEVYSSTWPQPTATTSVNDDGKYVVVGGWSVNTEILIVDESCGASNESIAYSSYSKMTLLNSCQYIDLSELTRLHSDPVGGTSYRRFMSVQMEADGSSFAYDDGHHWAVIYAYNMRPRSSMYYLALGDSFASGEGDASLDGIDHYLFGTNIYGDYLHNVARENCHQSDRAYSMLIAGNMGLNRGSNMQTVACSGAVTYDVWSRDKANYIDPAYLGQSTEKAAEWGSSTPRLSTVNNAVDLQTQARADYIPGRVQQIEQVKKAQPEYATIMIGGNDLGFSSALTSCITNLPLNRTCDMATPNGMAIKAREIYGYWDGAQVKGGSYDNLKQLYTDIQATSPLTKLYVIGYPKFLDDQVLVCPTSRFTLTLAERHSINQLLDYFNATIRSAAHDAGAIYIDISSALGSDVACGRSGAITGIDDLLVYWLYTQAMQGKQYTIDGITAGLGIGTSLDLALLQSYFTDSITLGSSPNIAIHNFLQQMLHPNAYGHGLIYKQLARGLGDELLASDACNDIVICPSGSDVGRPDVALYVSGISMSENKIIKNGEGAVSVGRETDGAKVSGEFIKGQGSALIEVARDTLEKLIGGTLADTVSVALHSDPVDLGVMTLRTDGVYELSSAIVPASLPVGWHVVHILGHLSTGIGVDVYTPVFVRGPVDDYDDDKIIDTADTCAFGAASGKDTDLDGVDDECDVALWVAGTNSLGPIASHDVPSSELNNLTSLGSSTDDIVYSPDYSDITSDFGLASPKDRLSTSNSPIYYTLIMLALVVVVVLIFVSRHVNR